MTDTCGVCNRPLHDAESRAAGIGPTCARKFNGGHGTAGSHQLTFEEPMTDQPKTPAVWTDGDPLMEAMAAAVHEQCDKHPEISVTIDDPRNIAAVAATMARQLLGATMAEGAATEETDEERTDRLQAERAHAEGEHALCGVTCEVTFPSVMLRNGILARAVPGSALMLDELLRRATGEAGAELSKIRAGLHVYRYGLDRGVGRGISAEYWRDLLNHALAGPVEPCDRDEQHARAEAAEAAIKRTVDQMRACVVASGSAGVNPAQVIDLLSPTWPNGNHEAPAPGDGEPT